MRRPVLTTQAPPPSLRHLRVVVLAASFLCGCLFNSERRAGGEDFPNTIGPAVAAAFDETESWNPLDSAQLSLPTTDGGVPSRLLKPAGDNYGTLPGILKIPGQTPHAPELPAAPPAPEFSAAPPFPDSVVLDTVGDRVIVYIWRTGNLGNLTAAETLTVMLDERYALGLDSANYIQLRATQYGIGGEPTASILIEDADGDSIINAKPGQTNRVRHVTTIYGPFQYTVKESVVDAGADDTFGDDNNQAGQDDLIISARLATLTNNTMDTTLYITWRDMDGDGVISPLPGDTVATVEVISIAGLIHTKKDSLVLTAGPNMDFGDENSTDPAKVAAAEDNQILALKSLTTNNAGDTLAFGEVTDWDGDGVIVDNLMDSAIVLLKVVEDPFPKLLLPARKEAEMVMVIFPRDSTKNYPLKLSQNKLWNNGARETSSITGNGPGETFLPNDTVTVRVTFDGVDGDSTANREADMQANLGADLASNHDDVLYSLSLQSNFNNGPIESIQFALTPDPPLPSGAEPENGTVEATLTLTDGGVWQVTGLFTPESISVTLTSPEGETWEAEWDREGNPL